MTCSNIFQSTTNEFLADPTPDQVVNFRNFLSSEIADKGETLIAIGGDESSACMLPGEIDKAYSVLTEVVHDINCDISLVRSKPVGKSNFEIREYLIRRQLANENKFT
jgi:hypothetical protein